MTRAAVFAHVVKANGFSAAGRVMGIPKTTVSKRVSDLEAELGVKLLNRTTRRLSLTEAGARVYAHCAAAVRHMEEAEREALALQREPEGTLTLAAPGAIGVPFILPAVNAFMKRYPRVRVTLLSIHELQRFEEDRFDILIWAGHVRPTVHAVTLIAEVGLALYASPAYLASRGAPHAPQDLAGHEPIAHVQSKGDTNFLWHLERDAEVMRITPAERPRFGSNDPLAVLSAIAAGCGIGVLATRLVQELPQGRSLVRILPEWRVPPIELSALYLDAGSLKMRLFLDFIASWFRNLGGPA